MLQMTGHGGRCCGVRHIFGFDGTVDAAAIDNLLVRHVRPGMFVEAVVTNGQLQRHRNIAPALRATGFKLVTRFKNPNSGNICNVFHRNQTPSRFTRTFGGVTRDDIAEKIG